MGSCTEFLLHLVVVEEFEPCVVEAGEDSIEAIQEEEGSISFRWELVGARNLAQC